MKETLRVIASPAKAGRSNLRVCFVVPLFAGLLAMTATAGCVKRTIVIESDPPGASVWINEHPKGKTPLTHEFITHGRYKFRLEKPGFRELVVREMVRAPIYQWIPIDFVAEYLLPFKWEDRHHFRYALSPQPPSEKLQMVEKSDVGRWVAQLKDLNPEARRIAGVALARERDPSTADAVLEATRDPSPRVRAVALNAWRGIRGKESLERLTEALLTDSDPEVRWQAAIELEALGDKAAVPVLLKGLRDRSGLVRAGAAEALKGLADPATVPAMIKALWDSDTSVRRAAAEALGRMGDRSAVKPLSKFLFHDDFKTRRLAVKSLAQLKDPSSGPALVRTFTDWDKEVRQVATDSLIAFGDERVIPILIRRLRGLKPWTREHAAQTLGGMKARQAIEPLRRALRGEPNPSAAEAMIQALEAMGERVDDRIKQRVEAQKAQGHREFEERAKKKPIL